MIIGITGRAGSGKSFAARICQEIEGMTIIDLDQIGHQLLQTTSIKNKLIQTFGNQVLTHTTIDRKKLKKVAFQSKQSLNKLNQIIHPEIQKQTITASHKATTAHIMIVGALLHELDLNKHCDTVLVIDATTQSITKKNPDKTQFHPFQRSRKEYQQSGDIVITNQFTPKFQQDLQLCLKSIFNV